ncbi:MAG: HAMP domain-containing sensor histidine kinase [Prolixibacteraceae bacterium]|jgi:signal transduction histidine kinase|nr:HAMP domain-containing sensor histidine kinase [Prolixibacteraceae bacterium]
MIQLRRFFLLIFLCISIIFAHGSVSAKRVLLINSYSPDFPTYINVEKAILEQNEALDIDIEFLYGKELNDSVYFDRLTQLISHKMEVRSAYDAIVTIDNIALQFVLDSRSGFFQNIPVVFCGVEDEDLIQRALKTDGVSGITEFCSFEETIDLAKHLNPRLDEIVALTDNTITGMANYKLFSSFCQQDREINCSSIDFGKTTFNKAFSQIKKLSGEKAILLISAYRDSSGGYMPFNRTLKSIIEASEVPVYHIYEHGMGQGITGGKPVSHYQMVKEALQKVNMLSADELWSDTTIVNVSPLRFVVDYEVASAYNLKMSAIPDEVTLLNKPSATFSIGRTVFFFSLILVSLLLLFIVYLGFSVRNRRIMNRELLIAKEQAEEANRLKTAFITNMSHEIRTPMNSIVGFSSLLRSTDLNYETRGQYCQIIEDNSNHLLALISDIIDISKIESGDFSFRLSKIEVLPLFENLCLDFKQKIKRLNKKIKIELKTDIPKGTLIVSDKVRFTQLASNIVGNAVKYTHKGDITLACSVRDNDLLVYVKDTGIGISGDYTSKIFDRFTREEDAKQVYDGTGLGLAISKSIVDKFNGKIWVESEKGVGSTFYFTHPL